MALSRGPSGVIDNWQVVVEPADEQVPLRIFSVDLPAGQTSATVSPQYLNSYAATGVTAFKFEVIAREEGGNQTASEGTFDITAP